MKSQSVSTRAIALGPFLTLILLASPKRGRAMSEAAARDPGQITLTDSASLASPDEAFKQAKPARRSPGTLGPFLTLILLSCR